MLHSKVIFKNMTGPYDTRQVDLQAWMGYCTLCMLNPYTTGGVLYLYKMMEKT